jgi:hypothetical protein
MRLVPAMVALAVWLTVAGADAQSVYVRQGGRLIEVPLGSVPMPATAGAPVPSEGGVLRVDGLPAGAAVSVDGHALGGARELAGGWIVLAPGPHFVEIALPNASAIRFTVVTPVESSGYQVVPRQ